MRQRRNSCRSCRSTQSRRPSPRRGVATLPFAHQDGAWLGPALLSVQNLKSISDLLASRMPRLCSSTCLVAGSRSPNSSAWSGRPGPRTANDVAGEAGQLSKRTTPARVQSLEIEIAQMRDLFVDGMLPWPHSHGQAARFADALSWRPVASRQYGTPGHRWSRQTGNSASGACAPHRRGSRVRNAAATQSSSSLPKW